MEKIYKISRGPGCGDLVKIKSSTWAGRAHDAFGLLVESASGGSDLFPTAVVYNMEHGQIEYYYLYDLEVISPAA